METTIHNVTNIKLLSTVKGTVDEGTPEARIYYHRIILVESAEGSFSLSLFSDDENALNIGV